jgi:hypothetical protein
VSAKQRKGPFRLPSVARDFAHSLRFGDSALQSGGRTPAISTRAQNDKRFLVRRRWAHTNTDNCRRILSHPGAMDFHPARNANAQSIALRWKRPSNAFTTRQPLRSWFIQGSAFTRSVVMANIGGGLISPAGFKRRAAAPRLKLKSGHELRPWTEIAMRTSSGKLPAWVFFIRLAR